MRKFLWLLLLAFPIMARADVDAIQGYCTPGGTRAMTSGLAVRPTIFKASSPACCTVTVYFTGTTTLATLFSNSTGTVLPNPFTANNNGSQHQSRRMDLLGYQRSWVRRGAEWWWWEPELHNSS